VKPSFETGLEGLDTSFEAFHGTAISMAVFRES
jgi:hypothetical protein